MKNFFYFMPAFAWIGFIAWLCFTPAEEISSYDWFDIFKFDKLGHAFIFGILVFYFAWAMRMQSKVSFLQKNALWISFLVALLYSGLIEIVQEQFIPTRTGEWIDFVADTVGCVIGWLIYAFLKNSQTENWQMKF